MAIALRQSKRFSAGSPVTRYWLANCVGFSLTGGAHGQVERVLADDDPYAPSLLEVRTGRKRVRRVPTASVVEVVPSERLLVVAGGRTAAQRTRESRDHLVGASRVAGRFAVAVGIFLLWVAAVLARLAREAWRVGYPLAKKAGVRGGSETARLVRSVPWQQYGRSARSATTRLSQARSKRSSLPRTTSSDTINASSSSKRARTTSST